MNIRSLFRYTRTKKVYLIWEVLPNGKTCILARFENKYNAYEFAKRMLCVVVIPCRMITRKEKGEIEQYFVQSFK